MALTNLNPDELAAAIAGLDGWAVEEAALAKTFLFESFADAIAFVRRVASIAEDDDHHPDIHVRFTRVRIACWTHDTGGITRRDAELARRIDAAYPSAP